MVERLEGRAFDSCEGIQDLETPNGVENFAGSLEGHICEPIEVFRQGQDCGRLPSVMFERQPGEEIRDYDPRFNTLLRRFEAVAGQVNPLIKAHVFLRKANLSAETQSQIVSAALSRYEYEPLRDAMLTASPRAGALRGSVPLSRKQSGAYASDDELEGEYQHRKTAQSRIGPSETVLSKTSVIRRSQGPARQTEAETSMCEMWSTGPLER